MLPVGTWCSSQGETSCAGSAQSPKEWCVRHLPDYPPQELRQCFRSASPSDPRAKSRARRLQLLEPWTERHPTRDSGWLGAAACQNCFRTIVSKSILNWEKIYCNALMIFLPTSKAESEVVLQPSFVFASMLDAILYFDDACSSATLVGLVLADWVISRYILRPDYGVF